MEPVMDLSVVIPIYNEEETVMALLDRLTETLEPLTMSFEVVMVDDGSTDRTQSMLIEQRTAHPWLRIIALDRNHGQTCAMAAGFKHARGNVIATLDADLQNDPAEIPRLMDMLGEDCDMVTGWRVKRDDPWIRLVSTRVANAVRNRLSGETIHDSACSLKVYKRKCVENLFLYNGMHRFMPTLVKMQGFVVREVPVTHSARYAGQAKYGMWNRVFRAFIDLLAVRWMKKRYLYYSTKEI
jgi:glycosyltransferase involved in cell wall biosynthesis